MRRRLAAALLFGLGVVLLFVHTTMPALWELFGPEGDYPLASADGTLALASGFTPVIGAVLMLTAGLVSVPHRTRAAG